MHNERKGAPCGPFWNGKVMVKAVERVPALRTRAQGLEYRDMIAKWSDPVMPNVWRTTLRNLQCTHSSAFSASNEGSGKGVFWSPILWMRINRLLVASGACLPDMKPSWSWWIKVGRNGSNLQPSTFAKKNMPVLSTINGSIAAWEESFPGLVEITDCNLSFGRETEESAILNRNARYGENKYTHFYSTHY